MSPMLDVLQGFVLELRKANIPVSMTENLDAMRALEHIPMGDREAFKAALGATLIKHSSHWAAFETIFDVYFALRRPAPEGGEVDGENVGELSDEELEALKQAMGQQGSGGSMDDLTPEQIADMLFSALQRMDRDELRLIASAAVARYAGMEPGRPVGGTYYLYRTLRNLDLENVLERLVERETQRSDQEGAPLRELEKRLVRDEYENRVNRFKQEIEAEIRRRLVADRGPEAMAKTLRTKLPEDVDFMHASRTEMVAIEKAIGPLTRALAARLAQRRRRKNRGHLDFRATVRHSLSYGGVPAEPKFRRPRPSKPEIVVVADISGSVASFARFTLQFVYTMASQFSRVRSFVFIDGIDEVTRFFEDSSEMSEAVYKINTEADVVWVDGHSDYGHAFEVFWDRWGMQMSPKTSVLILGDARNNYHASQAWVLKEVRKRARHVYWLDPEPLGYWDSGDSIVSEYGVHCDGVYECRNLRQLESFVSSVIGQ